MIDLLEYGLRLSNVVFQKEDIEGPLLRVYVKDRKKNLKDSESWVGGWLSIDEVKKLAEYLELFLKRVES